MSKTIIISVGTSVITNHLNIDDDSISKDGVKGILRSLEKENKIDRDYRKDAENEIKDRLEKCLEKPDESFDWTEGKKAILFTSAEIHSLYKYYKIPENVPADGEKDKIILLCTDTPDSLLSAQIIRDEVLTKWDFFKEKCEMIGDTNNNQNENIWNMTKGIAVIKDLDVYEQTRWINALNGLYNFFKTNVNEHNVIVLIRTGGYKEFSAMLALVCADSQIQITSYYLFENSSNLLKIKPQQGFEFNFEIYLKGIEVYR